MRLNHLSICVALPTHLDPRCDPITGWRGAPLHVRREAHPAVRRARGERALPLRARRLPHSAAAAPAYADTYNVRPGASVRYARGLYACQPPDYCTYSVRAPASAVPYLPCTVYRVPWHHRCPHDPTTLFATTGNSGGLALVIRTLTTPGDAVLMEG